MTQTGLTLPRLERLLHAMSMLLVLGVSPPSIARATVIQFQALHSPVPGEELWTYGYTIGGNPFDRYPGLSLFFDFTLYEDPGSRPGLETFEVYRPDGDALSITESGQSNPLGGPEPILELAMLLLMGIGLAVALRWRNRSRYRGRRIVPE